MNAIGENTTLKLRTDFLKLRTELGCQNLMSNRLFFLSYLYVLPSLAVIVTDDWSAPEARMG